MSDLVDGALARLKAPQGVGAGRANVDVAHESRITGGGVSKISHHRLAQIMREVAVPGFISAVITVVILAYAIQPPQICTNNDGENCTPRWGVVWMLALMAAACSMAISYFLRTRIK